MASTKLPVPRVVEELEQARTVLADVGVDLADHIPSIVVVGDQSTGKSSLLSALTRLQLPVGSGTVTRAPLKIFIRPGTEHKATLQYRRRMPYESPQKKTLALSAADLRKDPKCVADGIRAAQTCMYESLKAVRDAAVPSSQWQQHVLGGLDDDNWLLKDNIELYVDLPGKRGSFTVVDLPAGHTEENCLLRFKEDTEFAQLETVGGGFGVKHLFDKLVQLQEAMVRGLDKTSLNRELQQRLDAVTSSLRNFEQLPATEEAALQLISDRLLLVQLSFNNACINAPSTDGSRAIKDTMISAMHAAAESCVEKQSSFIPGILGKKKVLDIMMDAVETDTKVNHPDILSEYTAVTIFQEFHKHVADDGVQYVVEAHEAVEKAIIGLLQLHLKDYPPGLVSAAEIAAKQMLLKREDKLRKAVRDVTHAYTYVVEPLLSEVLYDTYRRLLLLASGILVTPQDYAKAQAVDAKERSQALMQDDEPDDLYVALDKSKGSARGKAANGAGSSDAGAMVATMVGGLTAAALSLVVGPFAGPLGMGVGFLVAETWDAFRDVLGKYKAEYKVKKQQGKCVPGYEASTYQADLVPLPWPADTDPMTSFELMCKMMNCDPGYVVESLGFYYKAFGRALKKAGRHKTFSAVDLQKALIGCLCRMLCTHYSMTESVMKLVRMRLVSTHTYAPHTEAKMPDLALPTRLQKKLLKRIKAEHGGRLKQLLVTEEAGKKRDMLVKQKEGVEAAMMHLKAACS